MHRLIQCIFHVQLQQYSSYNILSFFQMTSYKMSIFHFHQFRGFYFTLITSIFTSICKPTPFLWIDRTSLLYSIAETDRSVSNNGFLLLNGFLPNHPTKCPYHHVQGEKVMTYKTDYAKIFLSTGNYSLIARQTYNFDSKELDTNTTDFNRGACTLLKKSLGEFYWSG